VLKALIEPQPGVERHRADERRGGEALLDESLGEGVGGRRHGHAVAAHAELPGVERGEHRRMGGQRRGHHRVGRVEAVPRRRHGIDSG
jgi:hypothetical protein